MIRRDPHAPRSMDRKLLARMVGLDSTTTWVLYSRAPRPRPAYELGTRPVLEALVSGIAPLHFGVEARVRALAQFLSRMRPATPVDVVGLRFGGTEEEIIARGSDWCTDVARVACALFQIAGFPSRIVFLANTSKAYSGHAIVEVFRQRRWGAVDPLHGVVYCLGKAVPATTWELMSRNELVDRHFRGKVIRRTRRGQFRAAAIVDYPLSRTAHQRYPVSKVSRYYRSILRMSNRGWPGGLRWIHGEDESS